MPTKKTEPGHKKILIVDDHPMMREGLAQLISREKDLSVCGEAEDAAPALDAVEKLNPDLVLIDITLTRKNGIELIKDIHAIRPDLLTLVISMHDEALYAERVLRAGGSGYIMKQEGGKRIMQAIRTVLSGQIYVSEKVSSKILDIFSGRKSQTEAAPVQRLSDRELEIFHLVGEAKSTKEIAERLNISRKTVEVHKANIKKKLNLKTSYELVSYAARWLASQNPE
ncbi:MAG: response regulator transcription factor [Opitutales bacterium]